MPDRAFHLILSEILRGMRVAINGFGRIGRVAARLIAESDDIELVAVNDLADPATMAHLFKYDSVHGRFNGTVKAEPGLLKINDQLVYAYSERNPENLPWKDLEIDIVIESTGHFKTRQEAMRHIGAGARRVIISAPADSADIKTIVLGINDDQIHPDDEVISNASCTTNSAAPLVKVVDDLCGIESGYITTVHSYTGDQRLHDAPHKDLRRARAAAESIVPTSTGAAKAITRIFPHLHGRMGGCGMRVPVPDGSITDFTCIVRNPVPVAEINKIFFREAHGRLKGILEYTDEPIVSVDIIGNPHSCIFDADLTSVIGNMVKVVGWYDNEYGYSARLIDLIRRYAVYH
jgi:glyceraldehyde 3-phosphate dehydrogenase